MKMQRFRDVGNEEGIYGNRGIYIYNREIQRYVLYIHTYKR